MANVRRFFRYDVEIPIYLQTQEGLNQTLDRLRKEIVSPREEHRIEAIDEEVMGLLKKVLESSPQSVNVFYTFNKRLDFIHWLLEKYLALTDPRQASDYKYRLREDKKQFPPTATKSTKLLPLMQDFYVQIDELIHELIQVAETSIEGRLFIFMPTHRHHFNYQAFVKNLELVAQKGVLPAQILLLLIEKYNLLVDILNRLKDKFHMISSSKNWPVLTVNLSAGGCSFKTNEVYEKFARFHVFMQLDEDLVVCQGRMVMVRNLKDQPFMYQVGIEFEFIPVDMQQTITRFIQLHELRDARAVYPEVKVHALRLLGNEVPDSWEGED